jgi:hypothetical protein
MHHGKKHHRTRKNKSRKMRGGKGVNMFPNNFESVSGSNGSSGWSYVNNLVGGLDQQYNNTLVGNGSGNQLVVGTQKVQMTGGRHHRRNRRGGYFGPVISDAIVPLGLLAAQQTYGKRLKRSRKSRRTRRR